MLDKAPADSGSRERALSWLFEELQLDEVMVFVAKLVTFLVVCGICSVTKVHSLVLQSGNCTVWPLERWCLITGLDYWTALLDYWTHI